MCLLCRSDVYGGEVCSVVVGVVCVLVLIGVMCFVVI